jgi:hypothetical protein
MASIQNLIRKAETGAQWADICKIEADAVALIAKYGYRANEITDINIAADGSLASVELGTDADDMARFVLNFSI